LMALSSKVVAFEEGKRVGPLGASPPDGGPDRAWADAGRGP